MPQYVNAYKFLTKTSTESIQEVFEEDDMTKKLNKLNVIFSDFVKKVELWSSLEDEFDYKKDVKKTQEKLEEIFKSLKERFSQETDERVEQVKRFRENLEGKIIPPHINKVT
jgi:ATP-dependent Lon protease